MAVAKSGPVAGAQDKVDAVYEALDQVIGYGGAGEHGAKLLQNLRMQKLQTVTGLRGMSTAEEQDATLALAKLTLAEQEEAIRNAEHLGGTRYRINGQEFNLRNFNKDKDRILDQVFKRSGVKVALNQELFGLTRENIAKKYAGNGENIIAALSPDVSIALPHNERHSAIEI